MKQQQNRSYHDDIVLEILSRSSVKSLLRFRCVCKSWKSLISSCSFRKMHRQKHTSTTPLFLSPRSSYVGKCTVFWDLYLKACDLYGNVVLQENCTLPVTSHELIMMNLPSQSKLVCFKNYCRPIEEFIVCNPSTKQVFLLPNPLSSSLPDFRFKTSAFGYIPSKDEYIMLHLFDENIGICICEVLTFSISDDNFKLHYNEWRSIKVTPIIRSVRLYSAVLVCGAFYWITWNENKDLCILSFDVVKETFLTFGVSPRIENFGILHTELLELNDELYIMNLHKTNETLELWKVSSNVNNSKLRTSTLYWNIDLQSVGCTRSTPNSDLRILIYRLRYLLGNIQPCNFSQGEIEKLELEKHEIFKANAGGIHSNLFTL